MTVVYEQWAEIPGTEGRYEVSNLGRVRNALEDAKFQVEHLWKIVNRNKAKNA